MTGSRADRRKGPASGSAGAAEGRKRKAPPHTIPPGPDDLVIGGVAVAPGRRREVEIPVAKLPASSVYVTLDIEVVRGTEPGPCIWLSAAIHGDELNGIESIRRLRRRVEPRALRGTLLLVPIVNAFGFINQSRYLPDRRDLNRSFPGSPRGSLASRLAAILMRDDVAHCSYGIDLHTGSDHRTNLPQIRANLDDAEARRCALAFGAPLALHSRIRDGSLRMAAAEHGKHVLLHEAGEALRFDEDAIESGTLGALRVMGALGMIDEVPSPPGRTTAIARATKWVRARSSGLLSLDVAAGEHVQRGAVLGRIRDGFGMVEARVSAPEDGMVIGFTRNPQVRQGDAVVHLATGFEDGADGEGGVSQTPPV